MSEARKLQSFEDHEPEDIHTFLEENDLPPLTTLEVQPEQNSHLKTANRVPESVHFSKRIEKVTSISLIFFSASLLGFASGVTFAILLLLGAIDNSASWFFSLF